MISFKQWSLFFSASFLFLITFSFNNVYAQTGSFPSTGNAILINTSLNVRDNPTVNAKFLGTQSKGASGVVVGGPVTSNGFIWWNIDYTSGPDGWSVENYMVPAGSNLNLATNNLYFKAIPSTIKAGETSGLVYSPVNATSCSSSQFNASVARGAAVLIAPTVTKTYSVTCNGPWGSVTKSVTVTVGGSVPVVPPVVTTGSPKITLTYPVGGEVFKNVDVKTTITTIKWSTTDFGSLPVDIILLDNSGYIIRWIATGISNKGSYTWFGDPSLPTGKYKVSVSSSDKGPSTSSASGLFEVTNPTYGTVGTPSITVLTPIGGSGYDAPGGINVVWSGTGFTPKNIVFYLNGSPLAGQQTPILATLGATTQSSYPAKLPNVPSGTDYTISVCDEGTPSPVVSFVPVSFKPLCGTSAKFSITSTVPTINPTPTVRVIYPNYGEQFTQGQNLTIKWTSTGGPDYVGLNLTQGGNQVVSIGNLINTGSYSWTIPSNLAGNTFKVKIYGNGVTDESDGYFSIVSASAVKPTVSITATPTSGGSYQINWSSTNATSCVSSGDGASWGWPSARYTSGGSVTPVITTTQTFTMTCSGLGGTTSSSVTINSGTTTPATPTLTVSAKPTLVNAGQQVTISWSSTNATSCLGPNDVKTDSGPSGSQVVYPTQTMTYTVYCYNGSSVNGSIPPSANKSVIVNVLDTAPLPTISLSANPTTVNAGQPVTISWSSKNSTTCSSVFWNQTGVSGSAVVYPAQSTDYSLVCSGSGGKNNNTVSVTVNSIAIVPVPAPSVILTANNYKNSLTVNNGDKVMLSWSSTGATSCRLADGMSMNSVVATSGTQTVFPNQNPTAYTVTCSNSGGASSKSVVVTVNGGIAQTNQLNQIASALAAIQALIIQMRGW